MFKISVKLVEPPTNLIFNYMELSYHFCEFILPKDYVCMYLYIILLLSPKFVEMLSNIMHMVGGVDLVMKISLMLLGHNMTNKLSLCVCVCVEHELIDWKFLVICGHPL